MRQLVLFAVVALLGVSEVQAQTLSIVNMDTFRDAILLEATLKRFLRDDGYTVKGASTEGFVVLVHGMSAQTSKARVSAWSALPRSSRCCGENPEGGVQCRHPQWALTRSGRKGRTLGAARTVPCRAGHQAHRHVGVRKHALHSGGFAFIVKPYTKTELLEIFCRAIGRT